MDINYKKRLIFNPDIELDEKQICEVENEILDVMEDRLGLEYDLYNWELEIKCIILADKKKRND